MSSSATDQPPLSADVVRQVEILSAGAAQVLPAGSLGPRLAEAERAGRPLRVKLGIDPSGSELTLGHAVVLRKLRQFQDLGHLAVLIIGDFTGMVGDPTGRSAVRTMLTAEQTATNATTYLEQVMRVLDPGRVEIRRNSEWLAPLTLTEVVQEASVLTVARLLERDDFAKRHAAGQPISLVEFLYPLLQGYDSVAVAADVEIGGTDQTYNLLVGRDFQRAHGQEQQLVLTVPLLEGLDGVQKMSKSLGNYVSLTEPPEEQFGKLMSIPDALVTRYAQLCTDLLPEQVAAVAAQVETGGPAANAAKRSVARQIVALYHGAEAAAAAEEQFDERFKRREVPTTNVPWYDLPAGDPVHLPQVLVETGLAASRGEARRLIDDGAVRLDGTQLPPRSYDVARSELVGRVLQRGKRLAVRLLG
ncbi:MAG: tyrosyl-tRNA synthetase [Frankiales bacterium]|jgi:tyrosyl-tRNA synthetase|nr:tyrosyl-tRNA synthetase [Frankiales bacterium]